MIDNEGVADGGTGRTVTAVRALTAHLAATALDGVDTAALVDLIGELETVKNAATAAQAAAARSLYDATLAHHERLGIARARRGRGVAGQVGLARRVSPHRATTLLGLARAAVDLPHTHELWRQGRITEHRMQTLLARITHLHAEDRRGVDTDLAGTPAAAEALTRMGEAETLDAIDAIDAHAHARDAAGVVRRRVAAEADRHVTSRRAPDQMLKISATLPLTDGVSVMAALRLAAEQARRATDDTRTQGQVMADTLVARVTGRDPLTEAAPVHVDVTMGLDVLTDTRLDHGPRAGVGGFVDGYGHVSADLARSLAADACEWAAPGLRAAVRLTGSRPAVTSSQARSCARSTSSASRPLVPRVRDGRPWCNAPIRHADHITPAAEGGPTTADNGQGYCEACNHTKQAPGWTTKTRHDPDGTHVVETTTPTGHTYDSRPPPAD